MKSLCKILLLAFLFGTACKRDTEIISETYQIPLYESTTEAEAEAGLRQESPHQLSEFGNIYVYQDLLLINERGIGIHFYDNSDPANPVALTFMNIPGNNDMAVRNGVLFADSYDDLLSLDISDPQNIVLMQRLDNVFPRYHPSIRRFVGYKDTTIYREVEDKPFWVFRSGNNSNHSINESKGTFDSGGVAQQANFAGSESGTAGSMARFSLIDRHLFTVDRSTLHSFDVVNPASIQKLSSNFINSVAEIETIFPYQNHLFIGSTNGLFIYDATNASQPAYLSEFTHARSCDPVYVSDSLAFVTLRSNTENRCPGLINQLDVINVQNFSQPALLKSFDMLSPHGLAVSDSLLFICEGAEGLKVFHYDKSFQGSQIQEIVLELKNWQKDVHAIDIIPIHDRILIIGPKMLKQYRFSGDGNLQFLSSI